MAGSTSRRRFRFPGRPAVSTGSFPIIPCCSRTPIFLFPQFFPQLQNWYRSWHHSPSSCVHTQQTFSFPVPVSPRGAASAEQ